MTDPGSSMSLTAIIVLTVVVLVAMAGWLGVVFFMAREPRAGNARPAEVSFWLPGAKSRRDARITPRAACTEQSRRRVDSWRATVAQGF